MCIQSCKHFDLKSTWNNNEHTEQGNNYPSAHPARAFIVQDGQVSCQTLLRKEFSVPEETRQFVNIGLCPLCVLYPSIFLMTEMFHWNRSGSVLFVLCAVALVSTAHVVPVVQ